MSNIPQVTFSDIQFSDKYDAEKARRLAENIQRLKRALNTLVDQFNSLVVSGGSSTPVTEHVLATSAGLGPEHTVSGLSIGNVLIALSSTEAAFRPLHFYDLDGVDPGTFQTVENGDVLQFINGYYTMAPFAATEGITDAEYLLATADTSLTNGRVGQNSDTIAIDFTTTGQFSAAVKVGSITNTYLDRLYSRNFMVMGA